MPQVLEKRLLTVDDFYRMADAGILTEDDRIELINGDLVKMTPIGRKHAAVVKQLIRLFSQPDQQRFVISIQDPLQINQYTEFQPDFMLLKYKNDMYASATPIPTDVFLVAEVADSSLTKDQTVKVPFYAQFDIQEVWIVNVERKELEVYREPKQDGYASVTTLEQTHTVSPISFPDIQLSVKDLFPFD